MIPAFSPMTGLAGMVRSLFSAGEPGVWYDPSDLSTMYQDAAGTTPVTGVEQPVGLILDKSKGLVLGSELVTNGTFDSNVSGWTSNQGQTPVWSAGVLRLSTQGGTGTSVLQAINCVVGRTYAVSFSYRLAIGYGLGPGLRISTSGVDYGASGQIYRSPNETPSAFVNRTAVFTATQSTIYVYLIISGGSATYTCDFDNISVRELPGNHATQATTASRPTLKQDASGKYYLSFDGVDDYLSTGSINFTATDKMTVLSGMRAFDGHIYNTIVAQNYPNSPSWYHLLKRNLPSELSVENGRRGSGSTAFTNTPSDLGGLYDGNIVTAYAFDLARTPELVTQRVNGAVKINGYGIDSGVGPLANAPLYIGSINATQHRLTGRLYGLIVRGAATDDLHLTNAEKFLAYKSGVTL